MNMKVTAKFKTDIDPYKIFENVKRIEIETTKMNNKPTQCLRLLFEKGGSSSFPVSCLYTIEDEEDN